MTDLDKLQGWRCSLCGGEVATRKGVTLDRCFNLLCAGEQLPIPAVERMPVIVTLAEADEWFRERRQTDD